MPVARDPQRPSRPAGVSALFSCPDGSEAALSRAPSTACLSPNRSRHSMRSMHPAPSFLYPLSTAAYTLAMLADIRRLSQRLCLVERRYYLALAIFDMTIVRECSQADTSCVRSTDSLSRSTARWSRATAVGSDNDTFSTNARATVAPQFL